MAASCSCGTRFRRLSTGKSPGFKKKNFVQYIIPSLGQFGAKAVKGSVEHQTGKVNQNTGRFSKGIHWYCLGAWK